MGSISIEMWRTRIGGFSASNYKAKSASTLETSPKYKRRAIIFVFIICFVSIASIITLNNREQLNTANYPNINDNSTPRSSNGTTIYFETTPFSNTTTPPPAAEAMEAAMKHMEAMEALGPKINGKQWSQWKQWAQRNQRSQ